MAVTVVAVSGQARRAREGHAPSCLRGTRRGFALHGSRCLAGYSFFNSLCCVAIDRRFLPRLSLFILVCFTRINGRVPLPR